MLTALRGLGVRNAVMLTGDSPRTAAAIAAQLGVDDFRAGVLPADKADYVVRPPAGGPHCPHGGGRHQRLPGPLPGGRRHRHQRRGGHRPGDRRHHHRRRQPVGAGAPAPAGHGPDAPHPEQLPLRHRLQWGAHRPWRGRHPAPRHLRHAPQPVHPGGEPPQHERPAHLQNRTTLPRPRSPARAHRAFSVNLPLDKCFCQSYYNNVISHCYKESVPWRKNLPPP